MTELADLVKVLNTGSREEVRATLLGLSAKERKTFQPIFRRSLEESARDRSRSGDSHALVVAATADSAQQARFIGLADPDFIGECVQDIAYLLSERNLGWLPQLCEELLDEGGVTGWHIARAIVRAGIIAAPDDSRYYSGTIHGVPGFFPKNTRSLADQLSDDPDLIGEHLLRMLTIPGAGRALNHHDDWVDSPSIRRNQGIDSPDPSWQAALLTLTQRGHLNRGALLDVVLLAPLRDWDSADLAWFAGMHRALKPTVDEIVARQETYARLLTVAYGAAVKLAQQALSRVVSHGGFEPVPVVEASAATLSRPDKTSVTAQLKLLEKLHAAHPKVPVVQVVRVAEAHPRSDVREQAKQFIDQLDLPPARVSPRFQAPAPVLRAPAAIVTPVASAGELAELLLELMEEPDPIGVERAIDGLLRYAAERPSTAALLLKRGSEKCEGTRWVRDVAVAFAFVWLLPETQVKAQDWPVTLAGCDSLDFDESAATLVGALSRRCSSLMKAVRAGSHPSVALPSRVDGSIDVDVLNDRLLAMGTDCPRPELELEVAIALLRVPPVDRGRVALPPALRTRTALRALADRDAAWKRVTVRREYQELYPNSPLPTFGDHAAVEGDALDGVCSRRRPELTALQESECGDYYDEFEQTLAMAALLNPHDVDALAAHAHPSLYRDLGKARATSVPMIDAIAQAGAVIAHPASSALVLGLAAKDARVRLASQDALLDLAAHGFLDGVSLGRQAALLLADPAVIGGRVSSGLTAVAEASDAAVLPVLDALEQLLPDLPGRKDAGPFVELAAQLCQRAGRSVELPAEFQALAAGTASTVLAKALRRLV